MFDLIKKMFFELNDTKEIASYCSKISQYKANFNEILDILSGLARDMLYFKYKQQIILKEELFPEEC